MLMNFERNAAEGEWRERELNARRCSLHRKPSLTSPSPKPSEQLINISFNVNSELCLSFSSEGHFKNCISWICPTIFLHQFNTRSIYATKARSVLESMRNLNYRLFSHSHLRFEGKKKKCSAIDRNASTTNIRSDILFSAIFFLQLKIETLKTFYIAAFPFHYVSTWLSD